jgi:hypothetical protein
MIAAYDHTRAAVVLAENSVKQTFTRAGVSHVQRVSALYHVCFYKIVLYQRVYTFYADFGRDVSRFQVAYKRMDIYAVAYFDRYLAKIFV